MHKRYRNGLWFLCIGFLANYANFANAFFDSSELVVISYTDNTGFWEPTPYDFSDSPLEPFVLTRYDDDTLSLSDAFTYAVEAYCPELNACDKTYQFTLTVANNTCSATSGDFLDVTVNPTKIGENLDCPVVVKERPPVAGSPYIELVLRHNGRDDAKDLSDGKTETNKGILTGFAPTVSVHGSSDILLKTLNGPRDTYEAKLFYSIKDMPVNGVPTGLEIHLNNTHRNTEDWCKAGITGWNGGVDLYTVTTHLVTPEDGVAAYCEVTITSVQNPMQPPKDYHFTQKTDLVTAGIRQWEYFTKGGKHYLVAAHEKAQTYADVNQNNVFIFNNNTFEPHQFIASAGCDRDDNLGEYLLNHPAAWRYFEIEDRGYLAMANYYHYERDNDFDCVIPPENSPDPWIAKSFVFFEDDEQTKGFFDPYYFFDIAFTDSALMWETYTVGSTTYIAVVNEGRGYSAGNETEGMYYPAVYRWPHTTLPDEDAPDSEWIIDEDDRVNQSTLESIGNVRFIESFKFINYQGSESNYVLLNRNIADASTLIYSVSSTGAFNLLQEIELAGHVKESRVFKDLRDNIILVIAYTKEAAEDSGVSAQIYRWENTTKLPGDPEQYAFVPVQILGGDFNQVQSWSHHVANGKDFLVALRSNGLVKTYGWNADLDQLETEYSYPVLDASTTDDFMSVTSFMIGNVPYLALAKYKTGEAVYKTTSPIFSWAPTS